MSTQSIKTLNYGLVATLLALQFALWTGDKNVFDWYHLSNIIKHTETEIDTLTVRNDTFLAEIIDLKNGGQAVETLARKELGFIKQGETFYQVLE